MRRFLTRIFSGRKAVRCPASSGSRGVVALVGTRGAPAQYGGFETAVAEIGPRLAEDGWTVVIYCRNRGQTIRRWRGTDLVNLPAVRAKALETLSHTALSVMHALVLRRPDVIFLFNSANAWFIPVIRALGVRVVVHPDGLEWRRAKWGRLGRAYYRTAERAAVRWADEVIADAHALATHYADRYGRRAVVIAYGAELTEVHGRDHQQAADVSPGQYHLVVARLEPENHVLEIIEAYAVSRTVYPLVVVGSSPYGEAYGARTDQAGAGRDVRRLGSIWDQQVLNNLYADCAAYYHGHSVGGTNPSLLRAMGAGAFIVAHDNPFSREVLGDQGHFFTSRDSLAGHFEAVEGLTVIDRQTEAERVRSRVRSAYQWDSVAAAYSRLAEAVCGHREVSR